MVSRAMQSALYLVDSLASSAVPRSLARWPTRTPAPPQPQRAPQHVPQDGQPLARSATR